MAAGKKAELVETFSFGPWSINAKKGPIITTAECERYDLITYVTFFFSLFIAHLALSTNLTLASIYMILSYSKSATIFLTFVVFQQKDK